MFSELCLSTEESLDHGAIQDENKLLQQPSGSFLSCPPIPHRMKGSRRRSFNFFCLHMGNRVTDSSLNIRQRRAITDLSRKRKGTFQESFWLAKALAIGLVSLGDWVYNRLISCMGE